MSRAQKRVLRKVGAGTFVYHESWRNTVSALRRKGWIAEKSGTYVLTYRGREVLSHPRIRRR